MESKIRYSGKQFSFQVDSDIVQSVYCNQDNYLIEYSDTDSKGNICAIYFSSNDIYFPNNEETFKRRIIERNAYEWYGLRYKKANKHIFLRDIFKQWYLKGINEKLNTPELVLNFLKKETSGMKTVCIGSSAGGYASVLFGSLLKSSAIYAFNAQFEIKSLLLRSEECINPLVHRLAGTELETYFELPNVINFNDSKIFYFQSIRSKWDLIQEDYIRDKYPIHKLKFDTSLHGIPFLKVALPVVLSLSHDELVKYEGRINNPILFSIKMVGLYNAIIGFFNQVKVHRSKNK